MMMTVRKATLADVARIREIADLTWPTAYKSIISAEQIEYMLNWMYHPDKIAGAITDDLQDFLVLENEDRIVGFAGIEHQYQGKAITRLHKLYVLPETQGTGAGKKLFEAVISEGKFNNSEIIHLNVNKANSAVDFYRYLGFEVADEEVLDIGNGYVMDDYIMTFNI